MNFIDRFILRIFLILGSRFFDTIDITKDEDNNVTAIRFSKGDEDENKGLER